MTAEQETPVRRRKRAVPPGPPPCWPGDPEHVEPGNVDFDAVAHILANTCRWGGRARQFLSLAQHALTASEEIEALDGIADEDRRALALHALLAPARAGVLKLGTVALDGTKVHANASRHSALSWKHACELEARLKAEVAELMALAEAADGADVPDGMSVPEELARREDRLARIAEAKAVIEARARERLERERAEYEAKLEARAEKAEKTGRKPGGCPPEPPVAGPGPKDQVNLTDADSRIMPVAGGGFEQAYNAQALVAADSLLVVTNDVVQAPNDKRQIEPALEALARLPEALGAPETLLADSGYFSEANVNACAEAEIAPLITPGRERHHLSWKDRFERHLARFVVDVVDQLELSAFVKAYRGSGSASYHPSVRRGLLVYGYATGVTRVNSLSLVRYRTNDYSVPVAYGHQEVWIRGYVHEVVIGCGAGIIARHPRSYDREDMVFDPIHYLPLLEHKIGALDQAAPLAGWELPDAFPTLRRLLEARMGKAGKREYVQVLRLLETFDLEVLHGAVKDALRLGAIGYDAVKHLVLCRIERRPPKLDLDIYPYLPRANVATTAAASYMSLLGGGAS